jgi:hypothetical protein
MPGKVSLASATENWSAAHLFLTGSAREEEEQCSCPGRFWGVVNPQNIPMGELKRIYSTGKQAAQLMRLMRRYIHAAIRPRHRFNRWSMSFMFRADYWAERLPKLLGLDCTSKASHEVAIAFEVAAAESDFVI